ncbi:MAG: cell wall-binding protein [Clostridium sp.]
MKKLISIIILLIILVSGIAYFIIFKNGKEESEILNNDVSLNNIKSIMKIENECDENDIEIPLGYKNEKIYLLKYICSDEKSSYEKDILTLKEDGTTEKTGIQLPDYYINKHINVYGEKIFCGNRCFNWITGEDTLLFDDQDDNIICKPVSGNSDYFFFIKNDEKEKIYILYDIDNKEYYSCNADNSNDIQEIFYDNESNNFYCIDNDNTIRKINLNDNQFTLEDYGEFNFGDKVDENEELNYSFCNNGKVYIGQGFEYGLENLKKFKNNEFNIGRYSISDNESEKTSNINICEYDRYYSDCVIVKKNDDESNSKIYFAKLKNDGPDIIMELFKEYGNDSIITIHMAEFGNVLIKETYDDKENKKVKNRYTVYNLNEYFSDNEYVLNNDGIWSGKEEQNTTLKNTFKNIDDSQQESKPAISDQYQIKEVTEENNEKPEPSNDDFREHNPSWRKGEVKWYYYNEDNDKVKGWAKIDDGWYYFDEDGVMQKNSIIVEHGCEFKLDEDGKMVSPENEPKLIESSKNSDNDKNIGKLGDIIYKKEDDKNIGKLGDTIYKKEDDEKASMVESNDSASNSKKDKKKDKEKNKKIDAQKDKNNN